MEATQESLLKLRAFHMGRILLLRQNEISLIDVDEKNWPDIVCSLLEKSQDIGRLFGIEVQGFRHAGDISLSKLKESTEHFKRFAFPVFFICFEMDHGYILHNDALKVISPESLNFMIERVREWYRDHAEARAA
ncbi:MAG: hypothetical protein QM758_00895 [Armatimonas sp.]